MDNSLLPATTTVTSIYPPTNLPTESIPVSGLFADNRNANEDFGTSTEAVVPISAALENDAFLPPVTSQQQLLCTLLNIYMDSDISHTLSPPLITSKATGDGNSFLLPYLFVFVVTNPWVHLYDQMYVILLNMSNFLQYFCHLTTVELIINSHDSVWNLCF